MIYSDYVLLILNCKKYQYKADLQKELWLNNIQGSIYYFHIIGDKDACGDDLYYFDFDKNVLYVSTDDDYISLPHKIITALRAVNETFEYKYIYKTDDDQMLLQSNFFTRLSRQLVDKENCHYGGYSIDMKTHICDYNRFHSSLPNNLILRGTVYCSGRFYLLSKKAVDHLLTKEDKIKKHYIEDHAIGLYLSIEFKEEILHFDSNTAFKDMIEQREDL